MDNARFRKIILNILSIIEYTDDQNEFVSKFTRFIELQALMDLVDPLPADQKDGLKKKFQQLKNQVQLSKLAEESFTKGQIEKALSEATKNAIIDYIREILPTLSENQKEELAKLFDEIKSDKSLANPSAVTA